jgi:hypothetical protein
VYYEDLYPLVSFLPRYANEPTGDDIDEIEKLPLWHISEANATTVQNRRSTNHSEDTKQDNDVNDEKLPVWHISEANATTIETRRRNTDTTQGNDVNDKTLTNKAAMDANAASSSSSVVSVPLRNGQFTLPPRSKTFDPEAALPRIESKHPLRPARNPPVLTMYDNFPILRFFRWIGRFFTRQVRGQAGESTEGGKRKPYTIMVESPIPLELCLVLSK